MKIYKGVRSPQGCAVTVDDQPLDPRMELGRSSDGGFEWGYEGAGPRRLALALLADHCGAAQPAFDNYPVFTETVIAEFKGDEWSMTSDQIQAALDQVVVVPMDLQSLFARVRGER